MHGACQPPQSPCATSYVRPPASLGNYDPKEREEAWSVVPREFLAEWWMARSDSIGPCLVGSGVCIQDAYFPYRSPTLSLPYRASDDRAATLQVVAHITVCKAAQSSSPVRATAQRQRAPSPDPADKVEAGGATTSRRTSGICAILCIGTQRVLATRWPRCTRAPLVYIPVRTRRHQTGLLAQLVLSRAHQPPLDHSMWGGAHARAKQRARAPSEP